MVEVRIVLSSVLAVPMAVYNGVVHTSYTVISVFQKLCTTGTFSTNALDCGGQSTTTYLSAI